MTDYEILFDVLTNCFWAGVYEGKRYYDLGRAAAQAAITVPVKIFELLEQLELDMEDGYITLRELP